LEAILGVRKAAQTERLALMPIDQLGNGLSAVAWDDMAVPIMTNFETDAAYLRAYVRDDRTVAGG
jgi:hypothetical protein